MRNQTSSRLLNAGCFVALHPKGRCNTQQTEKPIVATVVVQHSCNRDATGRTKTDGRGLLPYRSTFNARIRGDSRAALSSQRVYRFKRLLIVGTRSEIAAGNYRGNVKPSAVLHSLSAWEVRYDCPVVWEPTPEAAGRRVESWAFWFGREIVEGSNALLRATKQEHTKEGTVTR